MSVLKAVKPEVAKRQKPKIVIYGVAGIGKTWGALDFPNVYYIDVEAGATEGHYINKLSKAGGVYLGREQGSQSFETVIEQLRGLATEKHSYKTVVIDSFTKLFDIEVANEVERLTKAKQTIAYGNEKKSAVKLAKRLVGWADKLDMNVILICHSKAKYEMVGNENKQVGNTFDGWEKLAYELQLCLEITKQGNTRKAFVHKSRIAEFPDATMIDWNYETFKEKLGQELLEHEATQVELATPEQITEFNRLLDTIKLGETATDKRILELKEELTEQTKETIEKAIKYLQSKLK